MSTTFPTTSQPAERWRDLARLVRLPNVFTALADIAVGALAIYTWNAWPASGFLSFGCLFLASACLYAAGMVWNDFFDIEQDRRERPNRPIASGRVPRATAGWLGAGLMIVGVAGAFAAGLVNQGRWLPGVLALVLVAAIFLYDAWLKRTWAGPLGMGLCRFLNVLLGFSVVQASWGVLPALAVGVYIVGVTWFARTEARASSRSMLTGAASVMIVGFLLALPVALIRPAAAQAVTASILFPYLLVALGFWIGVPVRRAIARPTPAHVQPAVKRSIMGLVLLDALLASALAGHIGFALALLLLPALYLGRWIYST